VESSCAPINVSQLAYVARPALGVGDGRLVRLAQAPFVPHLALVGTTPEIQHDFLVLFDKNRILNMIYIATFETSNARKTVFFTLNGNKIGNQLNRPVV